MCVSNFRLNVQRIVRDRLRATLECEFKRAFLPRGWACVKIETFSRDLAKAIESECQDQTSTQ
jgi:hypothetical protein